MMGFGVGAASNSICPATQTDIAIDGIMVASLSLRIRDFTHGRMKLTTHRMCAKT